MPDEPYLCVNNQLITFYVDDMTVIYRKRYAKQFQEFRKSSVKNRCRSSAKGRSSVEEGHASTLFGVILYFFSFFLIFPFLVS